MLPRRPSRIFRSRWAALLWAAGVIWTAVTFIGFGSSKPDADSQSNLADATGAALSNQDIAALRNFIGQ